MKIRPLSSTDFYKCDHRRQYPDGTTMVYSNFTGRSSKLCPIPSHLYDGNVVNFGLQFYIKDFLIEAWSDGFFNRPKARVVAEYKRRLDTSLGVGAVPMEHIEALHDLGYLPICIKAMPEGTRTPIKVPCLVIYNTHPDFAWVTNFMETSLSNYLWKPMTAATIGAAFRSLLDSYAERTGADPGFTQYQGHDFSFRGMSGYVDAAVCGAGLLTSFVGTDTIPAIDLIEDYYNGDAENEVIGVSVPATEHSVMCMGTVGGEVDTIDRLITELYPGGTVSIVSDTWDFWKVATEYTVALKDKIMARRGKVVLRPDSGDPVKIICGNSVTLRGEICRASVMAMMDDRNPERDGYFYFRQGEDFYKAGFAGDGSCYWERVEPTPAMRGAVECLWRIFGGTVTRLGYRVLDSHIGLIYGDSITLSRAEAIMEGLVAKGYASSNIVLGIGSYTMTYVTRDCFGFAVKSTYGEVDGVGREIYKDPVTDDGTKKSAKGLIKVVRVDGELRLEDRQDRIDQEDDVLREVFRDGVLLVDDSISVIRARMEQKA